MVYKITIVTFVSGHGVNYIGGFEDGLDRIDLRAFGINDLSDLTIITPPESDDCLITVNGVEGWSLRLDDFPVEALSGDDFIFA